jgi:hypothetical protein
LRVGKLISQQVQGLPRRSGKIGPVTCRDQALNIVDAC